MHDDYLSTWPAIVQHLSASCPELRAVRLGDELVESLGTNRPPIERAAYVYYDGDQPADVTDADTQLWHQQYSVVLALKAARVADEPINPSPIGPLVTAVIRALAGWAPPGLPEGQALRRVQAPRPSYPATLPRWVLIPVTFQIPILSEGSN